MIHCAATVRFDHSIEEARRINVEGTRRVLDFAGGARNLRSLAYVGAAYVAGEREDLVHENELAVGQSYRNTYEQTKAEAEALVRSRSVRLPGVILRPSIVVGDSRTGATSSFKMMYWPLKIYARGLWRTVPGYPDAVLDIVPVDFVAAAVARLVFDDAGLAIRCISVRGPKAARPFWRLRGGQRSISKCGEPRFVDPKLFFAVARPLLFMISCGDASAECWWMGAPIAITSRCACSLTPPTRSGCMGWWAWQSAVADADPRGRCFIYCVASDAGRKAVAAQ